MFTKLIADFPILNQQPYGKRLAYLDSAATTQKPQCVIDAYQEFYGKHNANVHRGVHFLAESATKLFEQTRTKVQQLINAKYSQECIFTRGTTEAINLAAAVLGSYCLDENSEICVTQMEHHSNLVPWQMACQKSGAKLKYIPLTATGELDLTNLAQILNPHTKILALTHVSNTLGTINPIKEIIAQARKFNTIVLIDGTQAPAHLKIDVQELDCDLYTLSAHKMYGPMGVGILYGKQELLNKLPPYHGGGEMIREVYMDRFTTANLPHKFEAGTPAVADIYAWGLAIDYLNNIDFKLLQQHEQQLLTYATSKLSQLDKLRYIGTSTTKIGIISFVIDNIHPHDLGTIADSHGVAIRTGHHCTMPIMQYFAVPATNRISFGLYNTSQDIDQLISALEHAQKLFRKKN
jgi:cysteine desulfurase/selenocysteine lyase